MSSRITENKGFIVSAINKPSSRHLLGSLVQVMCVVRSITKHSSNASSGHQANSLRAKSTTSNQGITSMLIFPRFKIFDYDKDETSFRYLYTSAFPYRLNKTISSVIYSF